MEDVLSSFDEDEDNDDDTKNIHAFEEENAEKVDEEQSNESNVVWVDLYGQLLSWLIL